MNSSSQHLPVLLVGNSPNRLGGDLFLEVRHGGTLLPEGVLGGEAFGPTTYFPRSSLDFGFACHEDSGPI